jgi:predicted methyltransferase
VKRLLHIVLAVFVGVALQAQGQPRPQRDGRLFPPQDLGLLEAPDRDIWQHPDQIMDALGVADASAVADVGAGSGWFTIRLARRVGPNGVVYAQDVQPEMLAAIDRRVKAEGLLNVKFIRGEGADPRLPTGSVHAVLLVDAYHEIVDRVTMLRNLAKALRPEGRIGVIDFKLEGSGPGPAMDQRVSPETVINDARNAGLRFLKQETFLPYEYFLIFGLEPKPTEVRPTKRPVVTAPSAVP